MAGRRFTVLFEYVLAQHLPFPMLTFNTMSHFFPGILRSLAGDLCQVKDFQFSRTQSSNKENTEEFVLNWTPLVLNTSW